MNIPGTQIPYKPKTLTIKLKCKSERDATRMRMVIREILFEYGYKKRDFEFKIK